MKSQGCVERNGPLLVLGVGFGRTGTQSLKAALELLYQQPCYHMSELIWNHRDHIAKWTNLFETLRENPDYEIPSEWFESIFKGYRTTLANPACAIVKQLIEHYPEAKVVLSVRDPATWVASFRETIRPKHRRLSSGILSGLVERLIFGSGFFALGDLSFKHAVDWDVDLSNDEQMERAFMFWIEKVKSIVPPDRLLIYNVKEGWEPLCHFLQMPIPDQPFPKVNDREEMRQRMLKLKILTVGFHVLGAALLGAVAAFVVKKLL